MATNTPNFLLPKPDANENFNRIAYNALIDAIDSKVGAKTNAADTHIADLIKHITAGERDKWNASQLFALTSSTGSGKTPTNNDLNATITAGFYNVQASNLNSNSSSGTMFVSTQGSSGISQILHTTANKLFTRFSGDTGTTWSAWLEQETTAGAQAKVDAHAADAIKHITTPERDKWNGGQLFKLTQNDGASISAATQDINTFRNRADAGIYTTTDTTLGLPPKLESFERYGTVQILVRDNGSVQQVFTNFEGRMFHRYLLTSTTYIPSYADNAGWVEYSTVGKLVGSVMGNKITDQSNAHFNGKISGSIIENPHVASVPWPSNIVGDPANGRDEFITGNYNLINSLNSGVYSYTINTAGNYAKQMFSFNLIEHIQTSYGTIPGATMSGKVSWLKTNLSKLNFSWWGFGSNSSGNKATVKIWAPGSSSYDPINSNTASTPQKLSLTLASSFDIGYYINADGFIHFLSHAEVSDGTTPSVINTDYVELNVELSTDIRSNISNATPSTAGLQSGADKAKLDGISAGANKTTSSATNGNILVDNAQVQVYAHPTGDGNSHVPATGTTNNGKVLKAGGTANALSWAFVDWSEILNKPATFLPSAHTHAIADVTGLSTALSNKLDTSQRGAASGVASLGSDGKVPTSQLPTIANAAADITIADAGNYFDGANVETGMQEIGRVLAGARTSLVASAQQLGVI